MKIGTILKVIYGHAAIYVCLAVFFAFCWFIHHLAAWPASYNSIGGKPCSNPPL